jgi:hypothetical protein
MLYESLLLERMILETRYDRHFLYLDNCGRAMEEFLGRFPGFEVAKASPETAQMEWRESSTAVTFSHEKVDVAQDYPANLAAFNEICPFLIATVAKHFGVRSFTRVGNRRLLIKPTSSLEEAVALLSKSPLISVRNEDLVPFGDRIAERNLLLRVENDDRGYAFRLSTQERRLTSNIPAAFKVKFENFHPYVLMIDVDVYSKKAIDATSFSAVDFLRSTEKNLEGNLFALLRM